MHPKRRKPTHPGVILQEEFLKPLSLTPKQFAEKLGGHWTEDKVQEILSGKQRVNEKTAEEFSVFFDVPSSFWTRLEQYYHQSL